VDAATLAVLLPGPVPTGSTALVQHLRSAESLIGALVVVGERRQLTLMQDAISSIGFKVALALQRIALARELNQRASEAHFRALIQNASDVILVVGSDNQITYQTPSAARVLGYHPAELAGRRLEQLLPPEDLERSLSRAIPVDAEADAPVWRRPGRQGRLAAAVRGRQVDGRRRRVQQHAGGP
jgi:PAS domain S-box-containing protein